MAPGPRALPRRLTAEEREIIALCREVREATLYVYGCVDCHCTVSSAGLALILRRRGHDARLLCGSTFARMGRLRRDGTRRGLFRDHCWVECDDLVLDPTIEQFEARSQDALAARRRRVGHLYSQRGSKGALGWGENTPPEHPTLKDLRALCLLWDPCFGIEPQERRAWMGLLGLAR